MLAIDIIAIFKALHRYLVHSCIIPEHLLIGENDSITKIFLTGFGNAKLFGSSK